MYGTFSYISCHTEISKTHFLCVCVITYNCGTKVLPIKESSRGSSQIVITENKMSCICLSFFTLGFDVPRIIFPG